LSRTETGDHFSKNKQGTSSRRLVDLAAASKLPLLYRSVLSPPAGLVGVRRGGEPDLWVKILIKIVFFKD
jgi:hypothetical protein